MAAIKCTVGAVQMAMLLFEQYVFIGKSVNKTTYSDCCTVQNTDRSTVFVNCNFHITTKQRPGSSVGISTGYGLDGPGIKSRWG
jgi:hypothetical protein